MKMIRAFFLLGCLCFWANQALAQKARIPQFVEKTVVLPNISEQSFEKSKIVKTDSSQLYKVAKGTVYQYTKPRLFEFVGNAFKDVYQLPRVAVHQNTISTWIGVAAATGIAYYYDDKLISWAQRFGHWAGIPGDNTRGLNTSNQRINLINNSTFGIYVPGDVGYAMYYIGDGFTDLIITSSFLGYGLINNDYRALRVASELAEGLTSVGITIQILKRSFGRQSPWVADMDKNLRGGWEPFSPNYNKNVPGYDAMPSGHLATATMVLVVIGDNYPEYKWIYPTGIGLMTLLGYQMMNNGVHWMSDYPLGIAVGYGLGKMIVARGRKKVEMNQNIGNNAKSTPWTYDWSPILSPSFAGIRAKVSF